MGIIIWVKKVETTVVSGGTYDSGDQVIGYDGVIETIYLFSDDGRTLYKTPVTLQSKDKVITRENVPAMIFPPDELLAPKLEIPVKKADRWRLSLTNNEGVDLTYLLVFKIELEETW